VSERHIKRVLEDPRPVRALAVRGRVAGDTGQRRETAHDAGVMRRAIIAYVEKQIVDPRRLHDPAALSRMRELCGGGRGLECGLCPLYAMSHTVEVNDAHQLSPSALPVKRRKYETQ
jgi:hypothetical protein